MRTFAPQLSSEMSNKEPDIIYSPPVIDFVTVAVEFCAFLESEKPVSREEWISKMLKILPLMYIKASLLPQTVEMNDEQPETFVKEEDYVRVAAAVSSVMGEEDVYLDVFVEDMKYSERPISAFVSENMADIYQDVRNFVSVYQYELEENLKRYKGLKFIGHSQPFWHEISKDAPATPKERMKWGEGAVCPGGRLPYLFETYENLYGDLSANSGGCAIMRDEEFGLAFLEKYQDRLLFGTDMANCEMTFPLGNWLDEQEHAGRLSRSAYEKICRTNAEKLFHL